MPRVPRTGEVLTWTTLQPPVQHSITGLLSGQLDAPGSLRDRKSFAMRQTMILAARKHRQQEARRDYDAS